MLRDTIQKDIETSMKSGKRDRVEALRFLLSAVRNSAIAKYGADAEKKLTDADVVDIVKKQIKTHKESIDAFTKAGRQELVEKEKSQLLILEEFAPEDMSDGDLIKILSPIAASGEQNFGLLMKQAMTAVGGRVDGGRVAATLRQLVTSK